MARGGAPAPALLAAVALGAAALNQLFWLLPLALMLGLPALWWGNAFLAGAALAAFLLLAWVLQPRQAEPAQAAHRAGVRTGREPQQRPRAVGGQEPGALHGLPHGRARCRARHGLVGDGRRSGIAHLAGPPPLGPPGPFAGELAVAATALQAAAES